MLKTKDRALRGSTTKCPKCGSAHIVASLSMTAHGFGPGLASCRNCGALWEPFSPEDIWDPDDPLCSFKEPCNNCAFRPGSNEQVDREKWIALVQSLKQGAGFYCHKGVPIEAGAEHGFAYPSDHHKLRLCRGFLNALPGLRKHMEPSIWNCGDE